MLSETPTSAASAGVAKVAAANAAAIRKRFILNLLLLRFCKGFRTSNHTVSAYN